MITFGDIVMALFEFVGDFFLSFWPWGEDKKKDKDKGGSTRAPPALVPASSL